MNVEEPGRRSPRLLFFASRRGYTSSVFNLDLITPEKPRRIARAEYDQMVSMGLFDDERLELIDGVIVAISPNNPPHASPVEILNEMLVLALHGRARVRVQLPIIATGESEPEPDIAVVPVADYSERHPDRAFLVIEVADSSLRKDRNVKGPLHAASGFAEYWIINVVARVAEVYRGPSNDGWTSITRHGRDETLRIEAFPDVAIKIADILR
ncbi:MAG: Uma2 family endonuclease [Myxococcales bacterium]|nr:Uma2 family endonuclease [Myxococcales bacterium]